VIKTFKLAGKTYKVKRLAHDSENLGLTKSPLGIIQVQTKWGGVDVPEDSQEQTLYHELVHCILDDIGQSDLSRDETFVSAFSVLLHQFVKTAK
jgi:hypothetical protein